MIVWLASYPRSGNALFRKILKESFELDATISYLGPDSENNDWKQFYQESINSDKVVLIKTHFLPRDNQPSIYIVRDGRSVMQSYKNFCEDFASERPTTLFKLIMGDDPYGDWSSHFYSWLQRKNTKNLLLRFDELVNPSSDILSKIGEFLNFKGEIKPFINDFAKYDRGSPQKGNVHFRPSKEWNEWINSFFYKLHGKLMEELEYPTEKETVILEPAIDDEIVSCIQKLTVKNRELQGICAERQKLIKENHKRAQQLIARNRELQQLMKEKQKRLQQSESICNERAELIKKNHERSQQLAVKNRALEQRCSEMEKLLKKNHEHEQNLSIDENTWKLSIKAKWPE